MRHSTSHFSHRAARRTYFVLWFSLSFALSISFVLFPFRFFKMINKFRYKKPVKVENTCDKPKRNDASKCSVITKNDRNKDNVKDNVNGTLRRKKDASVEGAVFSEILDANEKSKIKELFSQLQFSTETALPPDVLRRALAESFFDQNRFQLGFMDDAAECFENMLLRIHTHIAHGEAEDMCNARHCIPHQKFAMTLVEQTICGSCGASSEPLSYTQMVHYVSTSTLVYQVRTNAGRPNPSDSFGQLLQKAGSMGDVRTCPSACGAVIQIGRTLMNHPEIVSIGLVWNSERPTLEHIMEVFSTIGTTLRLGDVFSTVKDNRWTEISIHNLVGVVTYYGKHYSTFFFHTKLRVWIYFDDATVREVGPRWEQVVEKCRKGRYQPLLLLYALPDGTPVNTENAPKQVIPFYTDKTQKLSQSLVRRSVTPSPEKPLVGNTRRAITPNPDGSAMIHKPPLPRPYNDYQNLSIIQKSITPLPPLLQGVDVVDGCSLPRKEPEYVTRKSLNFGKPHVNIHRTLSSGSSSGVEMSMPDHMNVPRRRDSGNWSGDRNSASSASSTTMENPYLYLVGKVPHGGGSVPGSPTRIKSDSSSGSSGVYDAGYDSYSLSSNDSSSMSTLQHLMKMGHLAKIPEDYNNTMQSSQNSQSCDVLCDEADELLVKSRQLEDEHDLVLALALCNAAATKARAAMDAPYNNPQTLTLARMKHNTCIMRARSLHRRMTQTQNIQNLDNPPEIRHTREGSSGSGRHSRQNSRDKGQHSRQNSKELLVIDRDKPTKATKNIEIYATLPKRKDLLKAKINAISIDDAEYVTCEKPAVRESRSIFSRSKNKDTQKVREKRSRSEDRNKISRDFSIAPEIIVAKDTLKKAKDEKEKEDKKDKDGKSKKQHKIRRKLLMGGLIKRKNRSMPDLTDADSDNRNTPKALSSTVDDCTVGLKNTTENGLNGYLSEGHLEFSGNMTSPNLERSKLMRKSFHCSAGKILTVAKVPPPPPLRTTSQLSKSKPDVSQEHDDQQNMLNVSHYQNFANLTSNYVDHAPVSLPYYHNSSYEDSFSESNVPTMVITHADVHHEQASVSKSPLCHTDSGVDEVDCLPNPIHFQNMELPPYPSPASSAIHSRQASEEFPPPPPPLDLSALDEYLPKSPSPPSPDSLLAQLQNKRQQILSPENADTKSKLVVSNKPSGGDTWLKELQAKQAALRIKKTEGYEQLTEVGIDEVNTQRYLPGEAKIKSVKDLASKFERTEISPMQIPLVQTCNKVVAPGSNEPFKPLTINNGVLSVKKREDEPVLAPDQIAEELREVEMINAAMNKSFASSQENIDDNKKNKVAKKKSVSFCDQVILVATAEEQEDDSYIPNPILERVLRSAVNKPETEAIRQEILSLRDTENDINQVPTEVPVPQEIQQPLYVRRNSLENLLNNPVPQEQFNNQRPTYDPPAHFQQNNNMYNSCSQSNPNPIYGQNLQNGFYNPSATHHYNNNSLPPPALNNNYHNHNSYHQPANHITNGYYSVHPQTNGSISPNAQLNSQSAHQQYVTRQPDPQYVSRSMCSQNDVQYKQYQCPSVKNYNNANNVQNVARPNQYVQSEPSHLRQSPHQPIPTNSPAYAAYYANRANIPSDFNSQQYAQTPRTAYNQQIRHSTPSPMGYPYQHPPSPSPSNLSCATYSSQQNMYRGSVNTKSTNNNSTDAYERLPPSSGPVPQNYNNMNQRNDFDGNNHHQPLHRVTSDVYQRVPPPHGDQQITAEYQMGSTPKYSPYQHILPLKQHQNQMLKKSVSFEPGTKGGCESPVPKAVVTPIIVNNANNSVPTDKTKCNLCRKKNVVAANLYCTDCEFYMSRFKPRS